MHVMQHCRYKSETYVHSQAQQHRDLLLAAYATPCMPHACCHSTRKVQLTQEVHADSFDDAQAASMASIEN